MQHDVEAAGAAVVKIEVDAAVVVKDEVADGVGALDVVGVGVESFKKLGVFVCDKGAREVIRPELFGNKVRGCSAALMGQGAQHTLYS